jgi:hypothetical protein
MKQFILLPLAAFALLAGSAATAQQAAPKEATVMPAKPVTKEETEKARAARRAQGKELGKQDYGRLEDNPTPTATTPRVTDKERQDARAARNAEGKELGKQDWGRLEDQPQGTKK